MPKRREPSEDEKALARDMEAIGRDFAAAFSGITRAFETAVGEVAKRPAAPKPSWVRVTEPRPGWFDRVTLRLKSWRRPR